MARFTNFLSLLGALGAVSLGLCMPVRAQVPVSAGVEINPSNELVRLLQAPKMEPIQWIASTDKTGGNEDFVWLAPGETRRIPLPKGALERLWVTSAFPNDLELTLQTGRNRVFPLLKNGRAQAGLFADKAFTLFTDLRYATLRELREDAALIATNRAKERAKWYFQASVRPEPKGVLPSLPAAKKVEKRQFKKTLAPSQSAVVESWDAPGMIYALEVAVNEGSAKDVFQNLRLQMDFEGRRHVDAPLLALAMQEKSEEFGTNAVSDFDGVRVQLRWPMPFKTARMTLRNTTDRELSLDVMARVQTFDAEPSKYRFIAVQDSAPTQKDKPVEILQHTGEGALVGLALSIDPKPDSPTRSFAYLEGDERITLDGKLLEGTGTEDYFSSAWYFPEKTYFHPYDGLTRKIALPPAVSMYRLHIPDALTFRRSLDFDFEVGNGNNRDDLLWSWTTMLYSSTPPVIAAATATDESQIVASESERKISPALPVIGISVAFVLLFVIGAAIWRLMKR